MLNKIISFEIIGKQGHVAYPHLATNPMQTFMVLSNKLLGMADDIEQLNVEITKVVTDNTTTNVIPNETRFWAMFEYQTPLSDAMILDLVNGLVAYARTLQHGIIINTTIEN